MTAGSRVAVSLAGLGNQTWQMLRTVTCSDTEFERKFSRTHIISCGMIPTVRLVHHALSAGFRRRA